MRDVVDEITVEKAGQAGTWMVMMIVESTTMAQEEKRKAYLMRIRYDCRREFRQPSSKSHACEIHSSVPSGPFYATRR